MSNDNSHKMGNLGAGPVTRREFLTQASAIGLSAALAGSTFESAFADEAPVKGGHLKVGVGGGETTDTLDPALAVSESVYQALRHFGETLLNVSPSGQLEPRLAEKFSTGDAVNWEFTIRKGVEFHNGKTVTPEDVVATLQRHSDEKSKSGGRSLLTQIDRLSVEGDLVKVALKSANADFPFYMADFHFQIQPEGGADDPASGVGSGPYVLESNEPGVRYQFKKFENYWDPGLGHVAESEVIAINDFAARSAALQAGEVHMINRVEPKVADLLKQTPGIAVKNVSGSGHYVFVMQVNAPPFDNQDLRMALKLAIDREEMLEKLLQGYGSVGNDMPINATYPLFDRTIPQRVYDPEQAAAYYKKSGHDGSPIVLRTAPGAFPGAVDAAQLFQQSAAKAGIPIEVRREADDGYWSNVWNKEPFCASYWAGRPTQDQIYSTVYLSTSDWNDTRFKNAEFDQLLFAARAELDPAKRKAMYSKMGQMLRDQGGLIAPVFNDWIDAVSDKVGGFVPDPNWGLMNNMAALKCWLKA